MFAAIAVGGTEILFGVKMPLRGAIMMLAFGITAAVVFERERYGRIQPLALVKRSAIFWALSMTIVYYGFR